MLLYMLTHVGMSSSTTPMQKAIATRRPIFLGDFGDDILILPADTCTFYRDEVSSSLTRMLQPKGSSLPYYYILDGVQDSVHIFLLLYSVYQ